MTDSKAARALRTAARIATLLSMGVILYATLAPSPGAGLLRDDREHAPGHLSPLGVRGGLEAVAAVQQDGVRPQVLSEGIAQYVGHFLLFIPLGAGAVLWWATSPASRRSPRRTLLVLVLALCIFAAATEFAQAYVGRDPDVADWFAGMAGALTGLFGGGASRRHNENQIRAGNTVLPAMDA